MRSRNQAEGAARASAVPSLAVYVMERGSWMPCGEMAATTATATTATARAGIRGATKPMNAAKKGSPKMRWRGERSGERPVWTNVERIGGGAKTRGAQANKGGNLGGSDTAPAA